MRIHCLQHVWFEGPAHIERWANAKGHALTATMLYDSSTLPGVESFDWLVVMGGPMNVYQEDIHPWLAPEKLLIGEAVKAGKTVVGICLGAQLIADVLGAQVYQGKHKEIGWLPVELTEQAAGHNIFGFLPRRFTVFQWHGDTFNLPEGAVHLARSEACENQAFLYEDRVLGLQFHLESTLASVLRLVEHCGSEIIQGRYIQTAGQILSASPDVFRETNDAISGILDRLPG